MMDLVRMEGALEEKASFPPVIPISSFPKNFLFESASASSVASSAQSRPLLYNQTYEPDLQMIKNAADFKRCFLICISDAARASGIKKGIMLSKMRIFMKLCGKYGAAFALCSLAGEEYELRNKHEFAAVGKLLGLDKSAVEYSMSIVGKMIKDSQMSEKKKQKEAKMREMKKKKIGNAQMQTEK
jgi:hypothetical protein